MHRAVHQCHWGALPERAAAGCGHQDRAEREHIRRPVHRAALGLLGSQKPRRTHAGPRQSQPGVFDSTRDAEVQNPRPIRCHHDIARLQITVDQTAGMDRLQRLSQRCAEPAQRGLVHRPLRAECLGQCEAGNVRGRQPRQWCIRIGIDHRRSMEPAHAPSRGHLGPESLPERGVLSQLGSCNLHCHGAAAP